MLVDQLPGWFLLSLSEFGLLLVGYLVERHYVSRVTVFTNALALNVHLLSLQTKSTSFVLFADFAIVFGMVMLGLYLFQWSAPNWVYVLAMYPMSSMVIGILIWSPVDAWYLNLILGVILQAAHAVTYNTLNPDGSLTYQGELSGQVSRFVEKAQITFDDRGITRKVDLALTKIEASPWWLEFRK